MTAVRPPIFPPGQAAAQAATQAARADPARLAAQKAFFEAALGRAAAPAAPAAPPRPQKIPDPAAEPPAKILRPGSLLDIRV